VDGDIAVLPQVDRIKVRLENTGLGVPELQQQRQAGLVELSSPTPLPREEERSCQLLSDRAGTPGRISPCRRFAVRARNTASASIPRCRKKRRSSADQHRVHDGRGERLQRMQTWARRLRPLRTAISSCRHRAGGSAGLRTPAWEAAQANRRRPTLHPRPRPRRAGRHQPLPARDAHLSTHDHHAPFPHGPSSLLDAIVTTT